MRLLGGTTYMNSIVFSKKQVFVSICEYKVMVYVMYLFTCYASAHTVTLSELFCIAHVSAEARARSRRSPVEWRPRAQSQPNLRRGGRPRWAPACDNPHVRYF